jgi:hypothetical protein
MAHLLLSVIYTICFFCCLKNHFVQPTLMYCVCLIDTNFETTLPARIDMLEKAKEYSFSCNS